MPNKGEIDRTKACSKCAEVNKCAIHWGKDCNRQGGKKIPRYKEYKKPSHGESEYRPRHKREYTYEPIVTRRISVF